MPGRRGAGPAELANPGIGGPCAGQYGAAVCATHGREGEALRGGGVQELDVTVCFRKCGKPQNRVLVSDTYRNSVFGMDFGKE